MRYRVWMLIAGLMLTSVVLAQDSPGVTATAPTSVRIYAVADLVAPTRFSNGSRPANLQDWATQPRSEINAGLERLERVLRLAVPEAGDDIVGYPESLCLVVRQSDSGHQAIADLLQQLRIANRQEIELRIEMISMDSIQGDLTGYIEGLLDRELSPAEADAFRAKFRIQHDSHLLLGNGRMSLGNGVLQLIRFTAVASHERDMVELRIDVPLNDAANVIQSISQTHRLTVGRPKLMHTTYDGDDMVWLVTATIRGQEQP